MWIREKGERWKAPVLLVTKFAVQDVHFSAPDSQYQNGPISSLLNRTRERLNNSGTQDKILKTIQKYKTKLCWAWRYLICLKKIQQSKDCTFWLLKWTASRVAGKIPVSIKWKLIAATAASAASASAAAATPKTAAAATATATATTATTYMINQFYTIT